MNYIFEKGKLYLTTGGVFCIYCFDSETDKNRCSVENIHSGKVMEVPKKSVLPIEHGLLGSRTVDLDAGYWYLIEESETGKRSVFFWNGHCFTKSTLGGESSGSPSSINLSQIEVICKMEKIINE